MFPIAVGTQTRVGFCTESRCGLRCVLFVCSQVLAVLYFQAAVLLIFSFFFVPLPSFFFFFFFLGYDLPLLGAHPCCLGRGVFLFRSLGFRCCWRYVLRYSFVFATNIYVFLLFFKVFLFAFSVFLSLYWVYFFCFFLSLDVSGLLARFCCACRIRYDGMALHCLYTLIFFSRLYNAQSSIYVIMVMRPQRLRLYDDASARTLGAPTVHW